MSGRSGYGRSRFVGKIIYLPANMMMSGLAPRVGQPGWAIRLFWRRVDEDCYCLPCEACILQHQGLILPPTILPPINPGDPPNPGKPPVLPPTLPPFTPPTLPGGGGLRPYATTGTLSTGEWGGSVINPADLDTTAGMSQWIIAQFSRPVTVIGGTSYGDIDISFNNYGPWLHGEDASNGYPATSPPLYVQLRWKQIASNSPVYKVGFGENLPAGLTLGATGSFNASEVYISENLPQAGFGATGAGDIGGAPFGFGPNPFQTDGRLEGQWIILGITGALSAVGDLDGANVANWQGQGPGIPVTALGRRAVQAFTANNTISAIQYNPTLINTPAANTGLLYATDCGLPQGGALGPLAGFNSLPNLTMYG